MRPERQQTLNLEIPKAIFEQMLEHSKTEAPIEACGILAGRDGKAERLYKMTNRDNKGDHFMMVPQEQFRVAKDIRSSGLEMLVIYHSHPDTPARLSAEDIRLALTPGVKYVVVSLQEESNPVMRGFALGNNSVAEVPIEITEERE